MIILELNQGSDIWFEERWGSVTGTRIESALGACYSAAKEQWVMGGNTWEFDGDELVCVKKGKQTKVRQDGTRSGT